MPVRVLLGWAWLEGATLVEHVIGPGIDRSYASIELPTDQMSLPGIEYRGVALVESTDEPRQRLFTGLVDHVDPADPTTRVRIIGFEADLSEATTGGLQVGDGGDAREIIHCMFRLAGLSPDRMDLAGWVPGPRETFIVSAVLEGATFGRDWEILDVTFTAENPAKLTLPPSEYVDRYMATDHWAYTTVVDDTLLDAERSGLAKIDDAISAIVATYSFSYPRLEGQLLSYRRDATRVRLARSDLVFVGSLTSARRWLRSQSETLLHPEVDLGDVLPAWIEDFRSNETLRLPLNEWRLAVESNDRLARVTHLWRCIELYAAGSRPSRLFSAADLGKIRKALEAEWRPEQQTRLDDAVSGLNSPPLLVRVKAALKRDGIELTPGEFALLRQTREMRNDLEHGHILSREADIELDRDISRALSVMTRILVTGVAKLSRTRRRR